MGSPDFSFRRRQRLQGSRVFANIRARGERRVCGSLIMNWLCHGGSREVRLGIVTGRRIGGAVVRSRARRLMREAFRLVQHQITPGVDIILVARASLADRPLAGVSKDLQRCLREARLWSPPVHPSPPSQCVS
ncbi:MAG: ribonuclease P protein component [Verrucomicrobiales bacterium]|nr:ribonuclease P protein component [Verrucomicrobiales bacterium]